MYTGSTNCVNGAVRLVNGRRPSEGSVQICVNGVWGYVCGKYYYDIFSTTAAKNARVVCRQLGYSTSCKLLHIIKDFMHGNTNTCNYPLTVYSPSTSNGGSQQPIIYGRMSCNGNEPTLSSCSKDVNYNSYCQSHKLKVVCEGE